jgi:hypothetical protein
VPHPPLAFCGWSGGWLKWLAVHRAVSYGFLVLYDRSTTRYRLSEPQSPPILPWHMQPHRHQVSMSCMLWRSASRGRARDLARGTRIAISVLCTCVTRDMTVYERNKRSHKLTRHSGTTTSNTIEITNSHAQRLPFGGSSSAGS